MPRRMLTDRFCTTAKARTGEVQTDYFDEGSRGLALRVSRTGRSRGPIISPGVASASE